MVRMSRRKAPNRRQKPACLSVLSLTGLGNLNANTRKAKPRTIEIRDVDAETKQLFSEHCEDTPTLPPEKCVTPTKRAAVIRKTIIRCMVIPKIQLTVY